MNGNDAKGRPKSKEIDITQHQKKEELKLIRGMLDQKKQGAKVRDGNKEV